MTIKLPRLMSAGMKQKARLHPVKLSITENLSPLSTASMELPETEAGVSVGDYVALYTAQGSAGIYRVQQREQTYGSTILLSLDHGLCSLSDGVIPGKEDRTDTASSLLAWMLDAQPVKMWQAGTVEVPEDVMLTVSNDHANILSSLVNLLDELPDYRVACDQTTTPWTLSIVRLDDSPGCSCRMSRNIVSLTVEDDRSDMCTRLYLQDVEEPMDAETIGEYGVISRYMSFDDGITEEDRAKKAERYLKEYSVPRVSITIDAVDLSSVTGQSFDSFQTGSVCLVALPEYSQTMRKRIVKRVWQDVYTEPDAVKLTLASESTSAASTIAGLIVDTTVTRKKYERQNEVIIAAEERIGLVSTNVEILAKDVAVNAEHIDLKASKEVVEDMDRRITHAEINIDGVNARIDQKADKTVVEDQGTRLTTAEINIDGALGEIEQKASKTELNNLGETVNENVARIDLTYDSILQQILVNNEVMTQISATLDGIDAWSKDTEGNLGELLTTAQQITGKVTAVEGNVGQMMLSSNEFRTILQSGEAILSEIKQLQTEIDLTVNGANGEIGALSVTANAITQKITSADEKVSQLVVNTDSMVYTLQKQQETLALFEVNIDHMLTQIGTAQTGLGTLEVTANAITQKVEKVNTGFGQLKVTVDSINGTVSKVDGRVGDLELTAINFRSTITGLDGRVGNLELKDNEFNVAIGKDGLGGRIDLLEGILNLQVESGGNTVSVKLNAMDNSINLKANKTYVDDLFAKAITAETLSANIAKIDYINMSGGLSANSIQAQFGIFANATVGNRSCAPRTLTIGSKSCVFFGPEDATFDLADTEEFQAAVSAVSLAKGDPSHVYVSDTHGYSVSIPYTLSNGKSGTLSHVLVADDAYNDGKNSVTVYTNNITCTNTAPNTFYVTVELTNGVYRTKTFTINVGQK